MVAVQIPLGKVITNTMQYSSTPIEAFINFAQNEGTFGVLALLAICGLLWALLMILLSSRG